MLFHKLYLVIILIYDCYVLYRFFFFHYFIWLMDSEHNSIGIFPNNTSFERYLFAKYYKHFFFFIIIEFNRTPHFWLIM